MPLKNYGVLRGRVVDHRLATAQNPHFQLHMVAGAEHLRIAVNVKSKDPPSEVQYLIDSNFRHPVLEAVAAQPEGWNVLERKPGGAALDFIRGNLFNRDDFVKLPFDVAGPDNDLNEKLLHYVKRAIADDQATAFAFGERWGPVDPNISPKDKIFDLVPDDGVHDIHMNQANVGEFKPDNGVYQDGALLLHFPSMEQWVAILLKFQGQTWHTDDVTGDLLPQPGDAPDGRVRIVGALANAIETPETELATLLNTTAAVIDLAGWQLVDRDAHTMSLQGTIGAGETLRVALTPPVVLPNRGGALSLLDAGGLKVDGVAYTGEQAAEPGRTIAF
jgi:uncharacterized protein YukJ